MDKKFIILIQLLGLVLMILAPIAVLQQEVEIMNYPSDAVCYLTVSTITGGLIIVLEYIKVRIL